MICSAEFRYSFVFYQYVGKAHLIFSGKNKKYSSGDWKNNWILSLKTKLVSYWEVEFIEASLKAYPWYEKIPCC